MVLDFAIALQSLECIVFALCVHVCVCVCLCVLNILSPDSVKIPFIWNMLVLCIIPELKKKRETLHRESEGSENVFSQHSDIHQGPACPKSVQKKKNLSATPGRRHQLDHL